MISNTDGLGDQAHVEADIKRVYNRCLAQRRPIDVTFVSRQTGQPVTRRCLPLSLIRASGDADVPRALLHFIEIGEHPGAEHPLSLLLERIVRIKPAHR